MGMEPDDLSLGWEESEESAQSSVLQKRQRPWATIIASVSALIAVVALVAFGSQTHSNPKPQTTPQPHRRPVVVPTVNRLPGATALDIARPKMREPADPRRASQPLLDAPGVVRPRMAERAEPSVSMPGAKPKAKPMVQPTAKPKKKHRPKAVRHKSNPKPVPRPVYRSPAPVARPAVPASPPPVYHPAPRPRPRPSRRLKLPPLPKGP